MPCACEKNITPVIIKRPVQDNNQLYNNQIAVLKEKLKTVPTHIKNNPRFQRQLISLLR